MDVGPCSSETTEMIEVCVQKDMYAANDMLPPNKLLEFIDVMNATVPTPPKSSLNLTGIESDDSDDEEDEEIQEGAGLGL